MGMSDYVGGARLSATAVGWEGGAETGAWLVTKPMTTARSQSRLSGGRRRWWRSLEYRWCTGDDQRGHVFPQRSPHPPIGCILESASSVLVWLTWLDVKRCGSIPAESIPVQAPNFLGRWTDDMRQSGHDKISRSKK